MYRPTFRRTDCIGITRKRLENFCPPAGPVITASRQVSGGKLEIFEDFLTGPGGGPPPASTVNGPGAEITGSYSQDRGEKRLDRNMVEPLRFGNGHLDRRQVQRGG
jgi:hypothetical protein